MAYRGTSGENSFGKRTQVTLFQPYISPCLCYHFLLIFPLIVARLAIQTFIITRIFLYNETFYCSTEHLFSRQPQNSPFSIVLDLQNTKIRSQWPHGLRHSSAAARFSDYSFESRHGDVCLSLENVACCQVEVCATGQSLVGRPTERVCVTECEQLQQ